MSMQTRFIPVASKPAAVTHTQTTQAKPSNHKETSNE
jgi:hypothetical protein